MPSWCACWRAWNSATPSPSRCTAASPRSSPSPGTSRASAQPASSRSRRNATSLRTCRGWRLPGNEGKQLALLALALGKVQQLPGEVAGTEVVDLLEAPADGTPRRFGAVRAGLAVAVQDDRHAARPVRRGDFVEAPLQLQVQRPVH